MKPRNLMVPHMLKRKSGAHGKTTKAVRRKQRVETKNLGGVVQW